MMGGSKGKFNWGSDINANGDGTLELAELGQALNSNCSAAIWFKTVFEWRPVTAPGGTRTPIKIIIKAYFRQFSGAFPAPDP